MKPTPTVVNRDALEALHASAAGTALALIAAGQELAPMMLLGKVTGNPSEKQTAQIMGVLPPEFVNAMQRNGRTKEAFIPLVRAILVDGPVDAVIHITEAWVSTLAKDEPEPDAAIARMARDGVKNEPGRGEAMIVTLHTLDGSFMSISPITTDAAGKRHCVLGAFAPPGLEMSGRLSLNPEPPGP